MMGSKNSEKEYLIALSCHAYLQFLLAKAYLSLHFSNGGNVDANPRGLI
jgi:hypothetical protein